MSPRVHQNCATCTCIEVGDTLIRAVVAATPEQLAEHHEMAALLEMDREVALTIQQEVA